MAEPQSDSGNGFTITSENRELTCPRCDYTNTAENYIQANSEATKASREFLVTISQTYRVSASDPVAASELAFGKCSRAKLVMLTVEIDEDGVDTTPGECIFMGRGRHCKHPGIEAMRWLEFNANSVYVDAEDGSFNRYKQIWHRQTSKQLLRDAVLAEKERRKHESLANQYTSAKPTRRAPPSTTDSREKQLQGTRWHEFDGRNNHRYEYYCDNDDDCFNKAGKACELVDEMGRCFIINILNYLESNAVAIYVADEHDMNGSRLLWKKGAGLIQHTVREVLCSKS